MDYNETGELYINYRSYPHGTHMDRMHFHNSYEMYVMLEGRKNYYLNGKEILLEAPAVILIIPAILHRASSPDDLPQRRMLINFSLGIMNRFDDVRDQTVLGKNNPAMAFRTDRKFCEKLVQDICRLRDRSGMLENVRLAGRIFDAVCELSAIEPYFFIDEGGQSADERRVIEILTNMQNNICEMQPLEQLASRFGCTADGLTRLLKRYTGLTYRDHINSIRMEKAVEMLVYSSRTMEAIASECGFSSANYFGDSIQKQFGIPPTEIRRYLRKVIQEENENIRGMDLIHRLKKRKEEELMS